MHAGERISRLPYCGLRPHRLDSFGSLRAWPKWKTLQVIWGVIRRLAEGGVRKGLGEEINMAEAVLVGKPLQLCDEELKVLQDARIAKVYFTVFSIG